MNEGQTVFFITGIEIKPLGRFHQSYIDYRMNGTNLTIESPIVEKRTFGWVSSYEEAEKIVLSNAGDISEGGSCKWMVIEEIGEGIYFMKMKKQQFFEFVGDWETDGHYEPLSECPKQIRDCKENKCSFDFFATLG